MQRQIWIDPRVQRNEWPKGPWDREPDKAQWMDRTTGLACLAKRHPFGHWCGYVGVAPGHPWHKKGYSDLESLVDVHGGITFAADCQEGPAAETVCHIPGPGEPEHLWWFGFDCAHACDVSPQDLVWLRDHGYPFSVDRNQHYRTLTYVRRECSRLARQLLAIAA